MRTVISSFLIGGLILIAAVSSPAATKKPLVLTATGRHTIPTPEEEPNFPNAIQSA